MRRPTVKQMAGATASLFFTGTMAVSESAGGGPVRPVEASAAAQAPLVTLPVLTTTTVAPTTTTVAPTTTTTAHVHVERVRASRDRPSTGNQEIGRRLLLERWGEDQWPCLEALWNRESGWREYAQNPRSGAYGIPQSHPGTKMASAGADWRTNPETQIRWGLNYIQARYGTPCKADQVQRRTRSY